MSDTIRTETQLLALFADAQPAGSITAQDVRDLIISLTVNQGHGWTMHHDGEYHPTNKRVITAGTKSQVTIDNLGTFTDITNIEEDFSPLWNPVTNLLEPTDPNGAHDFRFSFASDTSSNNNFIEFDIDIGGGVGTFYQETRSYVKGTGIENRFTFTFPAFVSQTFVDNKGTFSITPNGTANFWDFRLFIINTYKPQH